MKFNLLKLSKLLLLVSAVCSAQRTNIVSIKPTDTESEIIWKASQIVPTERQLKWQKLELTAFFHFGINTFTNREWGNGKEDIQQFNPKNLDANQWVTAVKKAGFKQVILTAKHHDGFCLWPTKTTEHSVKNTPWKNGNGDVVKDVAEACKKQGIGFGIYLSPWDMNSRYYGTDEYNRFFEKQLTELLTRYGKVDEVWFDGANGEGPNGKKQEYDFNSWYALIRKLQPQAVIAIMGPDVRWVGTETGRGRETEWSVVPTNQLDQINISENSQKNLTFKPSGDLIGDDLGSREKILNAKGLVWYPAETDVSIRPGWFYHASEDAKVKSPQALFDIYLSSVGRNSTLLLNIPPNQEGLISEADLQSLQGFSEIITKTFSKNLAKNKVYYSVKNKKELGDLKLETSVTLKSSKILTINFKKVTESNLICLQENIENGQQVEKFRVEYLENGIWKPLTSGTTIGYKRILAYPSIKTDKIQIVFEKYRSLPEISEVGVYFKP